jgi:hypothetical protein
MSAQLRRYALKYVGGQITAIRAKSAANVMDRPKRPSSLASFSQLLGAVVARAPGFVFAEFAGQFLRRHIAVFTTHDRNS